MAQAIALQYANRRDDDGTATNPVGEALLIADRVETLVGIWGIGLKPTGEKDPFALRRHALTLIHAFGRVAAASPDAARRAVAARAAAAMPARTFDPVALQPGTLEEVEDFIYERYANQLRRDLRRPHASTR